MKEFNLTDYHCNPDKTVVDENSNPVSIINTDYKDPDGYTNIVVINPDTKNNTITRANNNGQTIEGGQLFFKSQTLERYVAIYSYGDDDFCCREDVYPSKKEADDTCSGDESYIGAFKVTITIP